MSTGQFGGGNSSIDIPSSWVCIGLCGVNKKPTSSEKKAFVTPLPIREKVLKVDYRKIQNWLT